MTRLVQLKRGDARRVALVEEPHLRLLDGCSSIYELANSAIAGGVKLSDAGAAAGHGRSARLRPDLPRAIGVAILPPIDHPDEPARCLVSGTGLTHLGSARNRQSMHAIDRSGPDRQHENVSLGSRRRPPRARTDRDRTRVVLQRHGHDRCARTASRSRFRPTRRMAARKRRSPAST